MKKLKIYALNRLRMGSDGEGVTTLVACTGCPLTCRYCINAHVCIAGARAMEYDAGALVAALRVDHLYFAATGGGVTFGGGEPLLQAEALAAFAAAKPAEWKMNVETSLNVPEDAVRMLMERVDGWIVDIKDMNPDIYRDYTGKDNAQVVRNLRLLKPEKVRVRVPLIPGFNTPADNDRSEAALRAMGFEEIERFEYIT